MLPRADFLLACAVVISAAALNGCSGPTKAGMEARSQAHDRLNLFNAQLAFDQAKQAFEVGRLERALRQIDSAIVQYPQMSDYHVLRGRINLEMHRLEAAIESLDRAIEIDPQNPEAHYFAGIVYQRWSDDETAYGHYRRAAQLDEADVNYLLAAAESLVALGEFDAAQTLLEERLQHFENNSAIHHLLGQIAMMEGDVDEASRRYAKARLLNPEDDTLLEELARVQYVAGDYQQCLESVKQLQVVSETSRTDLMLLEGRCLALLGRNTEARNLYGRLSREDPSNADVWVELGTVAWELEDFHRVAQCGARVTSLAPERFEGYMLQGVAERYRRNLAAAVEAFKQSAERAGSSPMPSILLGMAYEEQGRVQEALEAYRTALEIDPNSRQASALLRRLSSTQAISAAPSGR